MGNTLHRRLSELAKVLTQQLARDHTRQRCVICDEHSERHQGYFCEKNHFVCTVGGCFDGYARSAAEPGAAGRSFDNDGNLLCPVCNNPQVKFALPPGIESLIQLKVNVLTARAQADLERNVEKNLRAEFTRIQSIEVLPYLLTILPTDPPDNHLYGYSRTVISAEQNFSGSTLSRMY